MRGEERMSISDERPGSAEAVEQWLNLPMNYKRSTSSFANELDLMNNMQAMLEHLRAHLSKDGHSQLKRLIGNMDRPATSKRMKPVSLSELNTADLCFIIVAMFERRLSVVNLENEELKVALERANNRITKLERLLGTSRQSISGRGITSNVVARDNKQ